jgi:hypothetical protein
MAEANVAEEINREVESWALSPRRKRERPRERMLERR